MSLESKEWHSEDAVPCHVSAHAPRSARMLASFREEQSFTHIQWKLPLPVGLLQSPFLTPRPAL